MMNLKLRAIVLPTSGALMFGISHSAMADATFDLIDALVKKGVLTEEEAIPLLQGRENDVKNDEKKIKKGRVAISNAIDNAQMYGDIRVRAEYRKGGSAGVEEERERDRYKITFGLKTDAGDFYSDLAFVMGQTGRSDNATLGGASGGTNGSDNKETLFVKRAMVGWHVNNWLDVEAGRIANPLYTTEMVWDRDLNFEGLAEKITYDYNKIQFFGNFVQSEYVGDYRNFNGTSGDRTTNDLLAFQGGIKFPITDMISGKAAITYTTYTGSKTTGTFVPAVARNNTSVPSTFTSPLPTTQFVGNYSVDSRNSGVDFLKTIEIPAEIEFKTEGFLSYKVFADYVYNTSGDERYKAAIAAAPSVSIRNTIQTAGNDDTAWLLGAGIKSVQAKDPKQGDWEARIWWQDTGIYALDQNAVDSDFMDSRINMRGVVLKAQYNVRDNVYFNFAGGSATRKNKLLATVGTAADVPLDLDKYQLYQFDLTYKF